MKKTILYILIFAVLAGGVWLVFFKNNDNPFGNSEAGFTITDTAAIGKIFLSHTDGRSVTLERTGKGWILNGKYPVLRSTLQGLLTTMYKQQAEYPVSGQKRDNVIKNMAGISIKTEIYDTKGDLVRTFFVGDEVSGGNGSYMLMKGANDPYVVNIPGFEGYLTPRYSVNWEDWRDRHVFDLKAEEIKSVSVQYPEHTINSFTISQDNGKVSVAVDSVFRTGQPLNEARANAYLGFFSNVYSEGYMNGVPHMDSVMAAVPVRCIVTVQPKQGPAQKMTVYWRPLDKRSKNQLTPLPGYPESYDADRFYAVMNSDTLTIQRQVFDKIFRNGYEFYQETPAAQQVPEQPHSIIVHPGKK